ncbi:MAG: 4Fe-4S binding protein [Candidatus Bathyarchaeota archaeon]|nr:4Fe-4S binding protein [Candidatus Bathyarchaeota archaeon]
MKIILEWVRDKTRRVSILRVTVQLLFFFIIFYVSIVTVWKGLLLGLILGVTFLLGRFFCGWICPLGLYMDTMTLLRKTLRLRHWTLPERLNRDLHKFRYIFALTIFLLALPVFVVGTASLFDVGKIVWLRPPFSPYTLLLEPLQPLVLLWMPPFGAFLEVNGLNLTFPYVGEILAYIPGRGLAFGLSYLFVVLLLAVSFKVRRFWCRFCPTGISIAAVNRFRHFKWMPLLRLNKEETKCTKCGICKRVCPVQVTEVYNKKGGNIDTSMCTLCLRCVEMCPQKECLQLTAYRRRIFSSRDWLAEQKRFD